MHNFHIPKIKEVLKLAQDWEFILYEDGRNLNLIKLIDPNYDGHGYGRWDDNLQKRIDKEWLAILPEGTELIVERIEVTKPIKGEEYNYITFRSVYNKSKVRFRATLDDANKIIYV